MAVLKYTDTTDTLSFDGPGTGITASPAGQQGEMRTDNRSQVALLVNYTKGSETSLLLSVEFSPVITLPLPTPLGTPALGTDYYHFSNVSGAGAVTPFVFTFTTVSPATYRIPVPVLHQERMLRLSVSRSGGADATAGSIDIKVVDDSHLVTSAFANRQP